MIRPYEEHLGHVLDALYDGALLLTGSGGRAEALVLDVVVKGAGAFRAGPPADFRSWILGRMCRQYLEFAQVTAGREEDGRPPVSSARGEDAAWRLAARIEAEDPERFGTLARGALAELPPLARAAMWLVGVAGVGHGSAAAAIGVDREALRGLLLRSRLAMHEHVASRVGVDESGKTGAAGERRWPEVRG